MDKPKGMFTFAKHDSYRRISLFFIICIILEFTILYMYSFSPNFITILFLIIIPIMIAPVFVMKDLLHPFNLFFVASQFLFLFNMIDVNANKNSFRYGVVDPKYHEESFMYAILIIFLWYVFMYAAYYLATNIKRELKFNHIFTIRHTSIIGYFLIFIGILSYITVIFIKGGIDGILVALTGRVEAYAGMTYFIELTGLTSVGSLLLLVDNKKKTSLLYVIISFILLSTFGGRGAAFFGSIFPYLIVWHYKVKNLKVIFLVPLAFFFIIFAIGLANYRMYQELRLNITNIFEIIGVAAKGTQGGETLPSLVGSILHEHIDLQYGSTLINIIFAPIPSSIWESKPPVDESGIVGRALMGSDYWGLPPGPYGIAFFNFSFIGVIIFSILTGFLIFWLYQNFVLNRHNNNTGIVFYSLIIVVAFNIISTSSQITIIWYSVVFIFIKLLDYLLSKKQISKLGEDEY